MKTVSLLALGAVIPKIMSQSMISSLLPSDQINFSCIEQMDKCDEDPLCLSCYEPFTLRFSLTDLESCETMHKGFESSYAEGCNATNLYLRELELCLINDAYYVLTLGTVTDMCSDGHVFLTSVTA